MRWVALLGIALMVCAGGWAQDDAPTATELLDAFRVIDWDSRAKMAKPDPAEDAWRLRIRTQHALVGMAPAPVDELIAALTDENRHVRGLAAQCLGCIGELAALEPLKSAAADPDGMVRVYVVEALGRLGDESALDVLTAAENGEDRNVAYAAHVAKERLVDAPPPPARACGTR